MPSFRDDHILLICPGSLTTLAQLGLPESFTPSKLRIPSRMFPGIEQDTWAPTKIRELKQDENIEELLGGKVERRGGRNLAAKKDVIVGNGAPKPNATPVPGEKGKEESSTGTETPVKAGGMKHSTISGTGTARGTPGQAHKGEDQDQDVELPDADDNEEDDEGEEGEEGEELEEGEEQEAEMADEMAEAQEGDGELVEEIEISDDENMAEGEEVVEDIIEFGEESKEGEPIYIEDADDEEGAVWPIQKGKITDWGCFFALLTYIHDLINPTFHTPILIVTQPQWARDEKELITQFIFEKLKAPGLCLLDSATAVQWAYGIQSCTVIDVGYEKTDITPIVDFIICEAEKDTIPIGGEDMTKHLIKILGGEEKGWTHDAAEQLKCSPICEVLDLSKYPIGSSAEQEIRKQRKLSVSGDIEEEEEEEGVTNVAAIVASGKTREYLAKKEQEKLESQKGAQKNLPNWKREFNKFWLIEKKKEGDGDVVMVDGNEQVQASASKSLEQQDSKPSEDDHPTEKDGEPLKSPTTVQQPTSSLAPEIASPTQLLHPPVNITSPNLAHTDLPNPNSTSATQPTEPPATEPQSEVTSQQKPLTAAEIEARLASEREETRAKEKERRRLEKERQRALSEVPLGPNEIRREVEVGLERFKAAECGILLEIADAVYRVINKVPEIVKRQELWDGLIIVGNGSKIRGFKDNLLATMVEKYKISPSSATIFTSELPSSTGTPVPTGTSTPLGAGAPGAGPSSQVNPLLLQATTSSMNNQLPTHPHPHSQGPSNFRVAKIPEYFPEWKDGGFEEAMFLGAQVAAKVCFVVDQGLNRSFLSRVEYNDMGPGGINSVRFS